MSFGDPLSSVTPVLGDFELFIGDVEPESPGTGDLWADTSTDQWKEWSGAAWVPWGLGMPAVVDPETDELVVLGAESGETVFSQKSLIKGATRWEIVDALPATQVPGVIYFVSGGVGAASDIPAHEATYNHTLIATALQPGDDITEMGSGEATATHVATADGAGGVTWSAPAAGDSVGTHESTYDHTLIASALQESDVDDTPVDGADAAPVSSNWAFDHAASATAHGITTAAATVLDDTTVAVMVNTLGGADSTGTGGLARATNPTFAGLTLSDTLNGDGQEIARNLTRVVADATGNLTIGDHSGCVLVTSGNVVVPTTIGFNAVIIAGGAHTVSFNSTASAVMAAGDVMTVLVESATVIHAVLTAAADKVAFA